MTLSLQQHCNVTGSTLSSLARKLPLLLEEAPLLFFLLVLLSSLPAVFLSLVYYFKWSLRV